MTHGDALVLLGGHSSVGTNMGKWVTVGHSVTMGHPGRASCWRGNGLRASQCAFLQHPNVPPPASLSIVVPYREKL